MKTIIAAGILLGCAHGAVAAPYANIESNSGWVGNDYQGSVLEAHGGYKGAINENSSWYIQAGPALVSPDGGDEEVELSGKVGAGYQVSEDVEVYGEYSFITGTDLGSGVKLGVTYTF